MIASAVFGPRFKREAGLAIPARIGLASRPMYIERRLLSYIAILIATIYYLFRDAPLL